MSTHIESKLEDISSVVLMPGDPKRCEYIARKFLANSKIVNNVRGMTAYTGFYKSKKLLFFHLVWDALVWVYILMNYLKNIMLILLLELVRWVVILT